MVCDNSKCLLDHYSFDRCCKYLLDIGEAGVNMAKESINNQILFSVESSPYGISYADWTAKWWKWAFSIPKENHPLLDKMDKYYDVNQSGPVWFLAATVEGTIHRICQIPYGKAILVPVLNYGGTLADEPSCKTDQDLVLFAKKEMDEISDLEVRLDKQDLPTFRIRSPIFDVVLPQANLCNGTPGPTRGTADGYWLFLRPLDIGSHTIESVGSCKAGTFKIKATYEITIPK